MEGITVTLQRELAKQATIEIALCFTDNDHQITLPVHPIVSALFEVFHEPQLITFDKESWYYAYAHLLHINWLDFMEKILRKTTGDWKAVLIGEDPTFHPAARLPHIEPWLTLGVRLDGWGQARIVSNFVDGLDISLPYGEGSLVLFLELHLLKTEEAAAFQNAVECVVNNLRHAFSSYQPPADE